MARLRPRAQGNVILATKSNGPTATEPNHRDRRRTVKKTPIPRVSEIRVRQRPGRKTTENPEPTPATDPNRAIKTRAQEKTSQRQQTNDPRILSQRRISRIDRAPIPNRVRTPQANKAIATLKRRRRAAEKPTPKTARIRSTTASVTTNPLPTIPPRTARKARRPRNLKAARTTRTDGPTAPSRTPIATVTRPPAVIATPRQATTPARAI